MTYRTRNLLDVLVLIGVFQENRRARQWHWCHPRCGGADCCPSWDRSTKGSKEGWGYRIHAFFHGLEPQEVRSPPPPPPKSRFFGLLGQSKSHTPTSEEDHKPSLPVKPLPVKPLPAKPAASAKPALPSKALPPRPLPAKPVPSRALPAKPLPPRPPLPGKMVFTLKAVLIPRHWILN